MLTFALLNLGHGRDFVGVLELVAARGTVDDGRVVDGAVLAVATVARHDVYVSVELEV